MEQKEISKERFMSLLWYVWRCDSCLWSFVTSYQSVPVILWQMHIDYWVCKNILDCVFHIKFHCHLDFSLFGPVGKALFMVISNSACFYDSNLRFFLMKCRLY